MSLRLPTISSNTTMVVLAAIRKIGWTPLDLEYSTLLPLPVGNDYYS
jgi:hypothetical protein